MFCFFIYLYYVYLLNILKSYVQSIIFIYNLNMWILFYFYRRIDFNKRERGIDCLVQ